LVTTAFGGRIRLRLGGEVLPGYEQDDGTQPTSGTQQPASQGEGGAAAGLWADWAARVAGLAHAVMHAEKKRQPSHPSTETGQRPDDYPVSISLFFSFIYFPKLISNKNF
jgi:hypothetical protein